MPERRRPLLARAVGLAALAQPPVDGRADPTRAQDPGLGPGPVLESAVFQVRICTY